MFLGTTSAIPLKDRNVSGILIRRSETESVLLDCGEGSSGQIRRRYGDQADDVFRSINLIFISHNHTDHHIGEWWQMLTNAAMEEAINWKKKQAKN